MFRATGGLGEEQHQAGKTFLKDFFYTTKTWTLTLAAEKK